MRAPNWCVTHRPDHLSLSTSHSSADNYRSKSVSISGTYGAQVRTVAERGGEEFCYSSWDSASITIAVSEGSSRRISARWDDITLPNHYIDYDFEWTTTPEPTATPTQRPTATPTPTPVPITGPPGPPTNLSYTFFSDQPVYNSDLQASVYLQEGGQVLLTWEGDGSSYKVQQWDQKSRLTPGLYKWKDLPTGKFTLNGSSSSQTIRETKALIGKLNFNHTYKFRVIAVRNGKESSPTEITIHLPPPFGGHQADHTAQYRIGRQPDPRKPENPQHYDPQVRIPAGISEAVIQWNASSAATGSPGLQICELPCQGRLNDNKVITIDASNSNSACGEGLAGIKYPSGRFDSSGHKVHQNMVIESPAKSGYRGGRTVLWTNDIRLHDVLPVGYDLSSRAIYFYFPHAVLHEFGHTFGLADLSNHGYFSDLQGSIMRYREGVFTSLPSADVTYLREVYTNHTAHTTGANNPHQCC